MTSTKTEWVFDDTDRDKVFECLSIILSVNFSNIKKYKKYRSGSDGNYYCVIGGYQNWHGIPKEAIDYEASHPDTGFIVFAKRFKDSIELFMGKLNPMAECIDQLSYSNSKRKCWMSLENLLPKNYLNLIR